MATVRFDGETGSPELNRITAKKNWMSPEQSNKMGTTYVFDALHYYMGEGMYPDLHNEVKGHVAVKQLPVYAFEKTLIEGTTDRYNHTYIGNFTVGADKGDNNWFGLTDERVKDTAIRLEGTDHIKGVGFNYPWEVNGVKNIRYNADKEALCIVTGSDATTWSAILEQSYCGTAETEEEIEAYLEQEFKPAYECAYRANPLLVGVTQTLAEVNADVEAFKKLRRSDGRPYSYCEFWIDGEYDLYYLNLERNQYEKNGVNLYDELSENEKAIVNAADTLEQKNQVFINFRINRFKEEAPNYWHINDGLFQLAFLLSIGASDNLEKNMYPYKLTPLSEGGRWRFFQDDLDSIKAKDNQGLDTKPYSVELHDFTDETQSAYVFKGEDNAYFQALERAFPERLQKMGKDMLQTMYDLSPKGTKTLDKLMGFFDEFFFSRAQDYFTKSAYNNDAEFYEEAWNDKEYVASVDIHPLAQSTGDHYPADRAWFEKRMIYLMSKYGFGGFASYEDSGLGIISVRTQVAQGFTLTPAIDSYPTILGGQAQTSRAIERIKAGEAIQLAAVGGGNTNTYIVGADWLSDIGDLKDLSIDPSSVVVLSVASKRLRRLKVGDENAEEVTSYLATLSVQQCDSMETVDARNLTTLVGTVDLSKCPRLLEALFGGTNVTGVIIAAGSKVEHVQIPDSVTAIDLRNTKFLETFEYGTLANLGFLRLENVPTVDAFAVLKEAYNSDGSQLKDIRLVGFNYNGDAKDLDMISNLASDKDKDGNDHQYNGIDADGTPTTGNPVLEGKLNIDGYVYEDAANVVQQLYPTIEFTPKGYYVRFADAEVQRIVAENWGDGIGATAEQIKAITNIRTTFNGNTAIETFDEFEKFTGVTTLVTNAFTNCTNLKNINISNIRTFGSSWQTGPLEGTAIENIEIAEGVVAMGYRTFFNCSKLKNVSLPSTLKSISSADGAYGAGTFKNDVSLEEIVLPEGITLIGLRAFQNCEKLKTINFPESITHIYANAFTGTALQIDELHLPNLVEIKGDAFLNIPIKKITSLGNITSLPSGSFGKKDVLEEIVLPETLKTLSASNFNNCTALRNINLENIVSMGTYTFHGCSSLNIDVYMPNLTTMGEQCFNSTGVRSIHLPMVGSFVGNGSFGGNNNLEWVKLGDLCTNLPYMLFRDNPILKSVEIGIGVTTIGNHLFYGCKNTLERFVCKATTPPSLEGTSAFDSTNNCPIYVPDASVEAYKTATNWSAYADRIMSMFYYTGFIEFADPNVLQVLLDAGFDTDADGKISIEEAAAVTDIGTIFHAQYGLGYDITKFNEFKWFTNITTITNAFEGSSIVEITLPDSLSSISQMAFYNCTKLKKIRLNNVSIVGIHAFNGCRSLVSVVANVGVSLATSCLRNCPSLRSMVLNSSNISNCETSSIEECGISAGTGYIYVPSDLVASYQSAKNWSTYASQIKPINVADTLPDISTVAENDLYKVSDVYWKAELVDEALTWVEI